MRERLAHAGPLSGLREFAGEKVGEWLDETLAGDIRRIVLTHAHEDHCGLARSLRDEANNAEVFVHGWETGHRAARLEHEENLKLLQRAGVPDDEIASMRKLYDEVRQYADSLDDDHCRELNDGDELDFDRSGTHGGQGVLFSDNQPHGRYSTAQI